VLDAVWAGVEMAFRKTSRNRQSDAGKRIVVLLERRDKPAGCIE
jgi:hypothetical protein